MKIKDRPDYEKREIKKVIDHYELMVKRVVEGKDSRLTDYSLYEGLFDSDMD